MDITQIQKRKKKELEPGLEKRSQGKRTSDTRKEDDSDTIMLKGKLYELPPDYHELEEADFDDPLVKEWCEESDKRFFEKFGYITHEELFAIEEKANKVQEQNPKLKFHEAVNVVLKEIKFKKKSGGEGGT